MRTFALALAVLVGLAACGHDQLDFSLPDAGDAADGQGGSRSAATCDQAGPLGQRSASGAGALDSRSGFSAGAGQGSAAAGSDGVSGAAAGGGVSGGGGTDDAGESNGFDAIPDELRFQDDPNGYPAVPGQRAPWCERGQSFEEVCANDVDEDCDGTVDELDAIGQPCGDGCGEAIYVCDAVTNTLVCRGHQGCSTDVPESCGDGLPDVGEECDPAAPGETSGVTCTLTCERPRFVRCIDGEGSHPELCRTGTEVCNERIGACMTVIGPSQRRCPEIPVEGGEPGDIYPMLEVQNKEGEPWQCWVTCSESAQCPSTLSECYMGFCAVPL